MENLVRKLEYGVRKPRVDDKELLRLAIQVLSAEIRIEKELERAKSEEEEKRLHELLERVKRAREQVVELYSLMLFRKGVKYPAIYGVGVW